VRFVSSGLFLAKATIQQEEGAKALSELYLPTTSGGSSGSSSGGQFDLMSCRLVDALLLPIPPASISPS
jgi:hypothetical protein